MAYNDLPSAPFSAQKIAGVIVAVAIVGGFIVWRLGRDQKPTDFVVSSPTPTPTATAATSPAVETKKKYKDGTYSATGTYSTPGGSENIGVTLTLAGDIITDAQIQNEGRTPTTKKMQTTFSNGFRAQVIGKPIDSVAVTTVNGSSLTPKGFMDALAKIKSQAAL